jgi:hypothetical protein
MPWRVCVVILGLAAFMGPHAMAGPIHPCAAGTLEDYINLGTDGCTQGTAHFYNFGGAAIFSLLPGATGVSAAAIQVVPYGGTFSPGLQFLVNATAGAGEVIQAQIGYTVGLVAAATVGVNLAMTGSFAVADGVTTVVQDLCADG